MHLLIVKRGALGDVVRTSYFARELKHKHGARLRLSWLTAPASAGLLRFNPHIDDLWLDFAEARPCRFDRVFSLDDELETLDGVMRVEARAITGALLRDGRAVYSQDAAEWFDMGLRSRLGKRRADELKRLNARTHAQIFCDIFGVEHVTPGFYPDEDCTRWAQAHVPAARCRVGINPYSGGRWPAKELRPPQLEQLIERLLDGASPFGPEALIVLLGAGPDLVKNRSLSERARSPRLIALDTDASVQHLAAAIAELDYLVSSDSLALHLAIAQHVPFTAFFSPTSAAEIDDWGIGTKVLSTAPDYCSYRPDADNGTITAQRIIEAIERNAPMIHGRMEHLFHRGAIADAPSPRRTMPGVARQFD